MPDFSAPEYASYVALCRELRLERDWQDGDWFAGPDKVIAGTPFPAMTAVYHWVALNESAIDENDLREAVWLPQLADWLDMLQAAKPGIIVKIFRSEQTGTCSQCGATEYLEGCGGEDPGCPQRRMSWYVTTETSGWHRPDTWRGGEEGYADTREEAAARLWCAVTEARGAQM